MAKKKAQDDGLPWFKFFVTRWIGKAISDCDLATQGLFINLCAHYWLDGGRLSYDRMRRKFKRKQKNFDDLLDLGILKLDGNNIVISFLDEQLAERGMLSEQKRKAAQDRWNQNKPYADALQVDSTCIADAIREEEKREEEIRKEESESAAPAVVDLGGGDKDTPKAVITNEIFSDEKFIEGLKKDFPAFDLKKCWGACWRYHSQKPSPPELTWQWKQKLSTWLEIEERNAKGKSNNTNQPTGSKNGSQAPVAFGTL